jgi:hypothetical protein
MKTTMTNKLFMKIRRRIYRIACLLFAAGLLVLGSCGGNQKTTPEPEPELEPELAFPESTCCPTPIPLKGTKWKLAGFVDMKTGVLTEPELKDCDKCYTLTFDTDYTAKGWSVTVATSIDLLDLDRYMLVTIGESYDGNRFRSSMVSIKSFTVTSEELKLYYYSVDCSNDNPTHTMEYLFFKPVQP